MKSAGSQTMALAWPGTPQQATSHADIATPATTGLPPPRPGREALGRSRGGLSTKAASRSLAGVARSSALGAIIIGVINDLIEMLGIPALCEYIFAAAVLVIARPPGARPPLLPKLRYARWHVARFASESSCCDVPPCGMHVPPLQAGEYEDLKVRDDRDP